MYRQSKAVIQHSAHTHKHCHCSLYHFSQVWVREACLLHKEDGCQYLEGPLNNSHFSCGNVFSISCTRRLRLTAPASNTCLLIPRPNECVGVCVSCDLMDILALPLVSCGGPTLAQYQTDKTVEHVFFELCVCVCCVCVCVCSVWVGGVCCVCVCVCV